MWVRIETRKALGAAATSIDITRVEAAMGDALVADVGTALAQLRLELGA